MQSAHRRKPGGAFSAVLRSRVSSHLGEQRAHSNGKVPIGQTANEPTTLDRHCADGPNAFGSLTGAVAGRALGEASPPHLLNPSVRGNSKGPFSAPSARKEATAPDSTAGPKDGKIMIMAWGSRGDVQPVVALALCLKEVGFRVRVLVAGEDHTHFVRAFSIDAESYPFIPGFDAQATMSTSQAVANNCFGGCPNYKTIYRMVNTFQPDLLLYRESNALEAWFIEESLHVCTMEYCFHRDDSDDRTRAAAWMEDILKKKGSLETQMKAKVLSTLNVDRAEALMGGSRPVIYAVSSHVASWEPAWKVPTEGAGVHLTGYWVLDQEQQTDTGAAYSNFFGGPQAEELEDFLNCQSKVVYIGWGSMYVRSREFMAQLAVRTLMLAGRSGIILGSYHKLGRHLLTGAPDEDELKAFCDERVLWLQWAPHEWLMSRCDVVVHHGGCGTTAASLRAGRPTVITPVGFDQFEWAELVEDIGVGTATGGLDLASAESIAAAVRRCSGPELRRRAAELGERLREEDGARKAAAFLAQYLEQELRSGRWKRFTLGRPTKARSSSRAVRLLPRKEGPPLIVFTDTGAECNDWKAPE